MSSRAEGKNPIRLIEAKIASGEIDREEVTRARAVWEQQLRGGVVLPNDERITISERDLYHVLLEAPRILRKPERIARLIANVTAIHEAHSGRRAALSQWQEEVGTIYGYAILDADGSLRTAHIADAKKLRKLARRGDSLWRYETSSSFGTAPNEIF